MESRRLKILAIDDIQDNLIVLAELIREVFPEAVVMTALDGKSGLALAASEDPDIILLDIVMPDMDGFEVCHILKSDEKLRDIPIVIITALQDDRSSRIRVLECGAEAFLAKPIDWIELTAQIRAMVRIKTANDEKRDEKRRLDALVREQTSELQKTHTATLNLLEDLKEENEARKKSEEALRASEEKFSKAFRTSPYSITITDPADGRFIEVNETFTSVTGFTQEETAANSAIALNLWVNKEDREQVVSALSEGKEIKEREYLFRKKNGEVIIGRYSAQIVYLKEKPYILSSINDITEQKKADEAYRELHSQMIQNDKLATIGQLAAGVAHEISNPIGFIGSNMAILKTYIERYNRYIEVLEQFIKDASSGTLPEPLRELRQSLRMDQLTVDSGLLVTENNEGLVRVKRIVRDLGTFSRPDSSAAVATDLNSCLDSTINIVKNEIKYAAELKLEYCDLPEVFCNGQQINQVFMNLLINAVHAIQAKGKEIGEIIVRTWCNRQSAFVSVSDNGCGISPASMKKIFEAFYTTKEIGKGTGLGLSISADIVAKHGGEIMVTSSVGVGSTFTVRLPLKTM